MVGLPEHAALAGHIEYREPVYALRAFAGVALRFGHAKSTPVKS